MHRRKLVIMAILLIFSPTFLLVSSKAAEDKVNLYSRASSAANLAQSQPDDVPGRSQTCVKRDNGTLSVKCKGEECSRILEGKEGEECKKALESLMGF